jgi:hypothetical protein
MSWNGLLDREPFLAALARLAARRRAARERAEDEDGPDLPAEDEVLRLAADDARVLRGGPFVVRIADGRATQLEGPAGLALRVGDALVPLSPGRAVALPAGEIGDGVDARGARVRWA